MKFLRANSTISTELGHLRHVRFTPGSDRTADIPDRQLRANEEHCRHVTDCRPQNPTPTPPLPAAPKALVAHRGALGAGIVADIVLRPPVEVDIERRRHRLHALRPIGRHNEGSRLRSFTQSRAAAPRRQRHIPDGEVAVTVRIALLPCRDPGKPRISKPVRELSGEIPSVYKNVI